MNEASKSTKELYDYRIKLFRDAQAFKKPDRVPFNGHIFTWMFSDAGYSTAEATRDYQIIEKCIDQLVKNYKIDSVGSLGLRNPFRLTDALGGGIGYTNKAESNINAVVENLLTADDYDAIKENYFKVLWEKALFKKFPSAKNYSPQKFAEASKELLYYNQATEKILNKLVNDYGMPIMYSAPVVLTFFEFLFNFYRGIKGIASDIRRHPEELSDVCESMDKTLVDPVIASLQASPDGPDMSKPYDVVVSLLGYTLLSVKQFEKYYVPTLKKLLDVCEEKNKQVYFFSEGSWDRFGEFFNSYKKGLVNMMVEQDDPYLIRKKYPNICISGGLEVDVLGHSTPDKCVNMAKRVIDDLGRDGGLILMPNKMVSFSYDMKSENLRAVADFVSEYYL